MIQVMIWYTVSIRIIAGFGLRLWLGLLLGLGIVKSKMQQKIVVFQSKLIRVS